jgi:acyl carrier protein
MDNLSYQQWLNATKPKVSGTLSLHTSFQYLDYFIMLSSVASIIGNVSQSNYAAGNAFQDALARHRTAHGQPAVSLNLGPILHVGLVAGLGEGLQKELARTVTKTSLPIEQVLRLVEYSILFPWRADRDESQIVTGFGSFEGLIDDPNIRRDRRFGTLRLGDDSTDTEASATNNAGSGRSDLLLRQLALKGSTLDKTEAFDIILELIIEQIAQLFGMDDTAIDQDTVPLSHYGMDSLVAVRFRNWISRTLKARLSVLEILQAPTIRSLADQIVARSSFMATVAF